MGVYTLGISAVTVGAVANDGGPGTTLAALGYTNEGSAKLNQADATKTEFRAEEQAQPVKVSSTPGSITLTFQVMNPDTATMEKLFGGTSATVSSIKTWNMPANIPTLEQTVKLVPLEGLTLIIPRGQVEAKLNGDYARQSIFVIDVTVTALTPTKSGVGPVQFIETVA